MIEVEIPGGAVVEFPDGTPPEVMSAAIKKHLAGNAAPAAEAPKEAPPAPVQAPQEAPAGALETVNRMVSGATDSATQGASFGFMDEANAGMRAGIRGIGNMIQGQAPEFGANYDRAVADERARLKQFEEQHPYVATGANIAGGLAGVAPAAAAVKGSSLLGGIAKSSGIGAGYGALGGFGAGEGGVADRAEGAVTGGMAGAALGAAIPVAGAVAGRGVQLGKNLLGRNDPREVALDTLSRGMRRDQVTPEQLQERLAEASPRAPMSIMDVAGDNMYRQARLAETTPGPGSNVVKNFLHERQRGQVDRVAANIEKKIAKGDNYYLSLAELDAVRKQAAAPLYEKAYAQPFVWDDEIGSLLKRPAPRDALKRAHSIAAEEGRDPRGLGLNLDEDGNVKIDKTVASMQTLDYVKRGLDDVLETFRDDTTGKLRLDERGRAINNTRQAFLSKVDRLNPDYAKARQEWGGTTATMEAMSLGRRFASGDAEVTADRFRKLAEGDKDAFRIGLARELAGKVQMTKDGANAADKIFGSQGQRNRLRPFFESKEDFAAFEKAMNEEKRMATTRHEVLANSKTLRNTVDANDAEGLIGQAMVDASSGGLTGMAMGIARRAINKTATGMSEKPAAELASMLATSDPAVQKKVFEELVARRQKVQEGANRSSAMRTVPAAASANLIGQAAEEERQAYSR